MYKTHFAQPPIHFEFFVYGQKPNKDFSTQNPHKIWEKITTTDQERETNENSQNRDCWCLSLNEA